MLANQVIFARMTLLIGIILAPTFVRSEEKYTTLQPEFRGADPPPDYVQQLWRIYDLIPFPLKKEPPKILEVEYEGRIDLHVGRFLFPLDLRRVPSKVTWKDQYVNKYYTLIVTDLDYPAQRDRSKAEWLHWLVGNIRGAPGQRTNDTIVQYIGPNPREETGLHRYVYYLFRQPNRIDFTYEPKLNSDREEIRRERFSTHKFAEKYALGEPEAVTFCLLQFWHRNTTVNDDEDEE